MYFNFNIIFIIFSYQCLKIYTLSLDTENSQSGVSSESGPHDCVITVPRDGDHMPIPIVTSSNHKATVIYPDENGKFIIRNESLLKLSCPGTEFTSLPPVGIKNIIAKCLKGSLMYGGKNYSFDRFQCRENPRPSIIATQNICQNINDRVIEIGFKTGFGFISLYKACFDTLFKTTLYTWRVVNPPYNNYRQKSIYEPTFISPNFKFIDGVGEFRQSMTFIIALFAWYLVNPPAINQYHDQSYLRDRPGTLVTHVAETINVAKVYNNQTNVLESILKSKEIAEFYIKRDQKKRRYLVPDLLIPKDDFVYSFQQNASYFYENTVPQWVSFSEGVWPEVEKLVMRNVADCNATRKILSGTYLTGAFPDSSGRTQSFFLHPPERMPVPLHRWTLDYDVASESGLVYVALCDPYVPRDEFEPICETMPCPGARHLSAAARKKVYCCTKDSFEYAFWFDPDVFKKY